MDVKSAWELVKSHNPGMKPFTCNEYEKYYVFSLVPEDLAEGDGYGSGGVFVVDKDTGEYRVVPWSMLIGEPIVNVFDVSVFD